MPILKNSSDTTGTIKFFGTAGSLVGYLLCDGTAVSQSTYSALYNVITTTYNTGGEAPGTFRLPNLSGKMTFGTGQDTVHGLSNRTLAQFLGEEAHVLTSSQLPLHYHKSTTGNNSATHSHSATVATQANNTVGTPLDNHQHSYFFSNWNGEDADSGDSNKYSPRGASTQNTSTANLTHGHTYTSGVPSANHTHAFTTDNGSGGGISGTAHNNIQPSLVSGFYIRY